MYTEEDRRLMTTNYGQEVNSKKLEEEPQEQETNVFPIPSNKFTPPGIKDQLRTLYGTLEQFYLISHRIKNP